MADDGKLLSLRTPKHLLMHSKYVCAGGGGRTGEEAHVSEREPGGLQHTQLSAPGGEPETNQDCP